MLKTSHATAKQFFVYIMTNSPKSAVLYTGVTGNLVRPVWHNKKNPATGCTSRYNLICLVYYERFFYPDAAISREKEIKGWRCAKKNKAHRIDESALGGSGQ